MQCIMALICQYFLIYTVLVVVRAWRSMSGDPSSWDNSSVVQALEATQNTVNYVPMLCVLFLATRMRAIQLTAGHTERYGLPQWWVQVAMQVCTFAVLGQLLVILIFPCIFGHVATLDNDGAATSQGVQKTGGIYCIMVFRYLLMFFLYGGFVTLCVGIWIMEAPQAIFVGGAPPVSPAVTCVMLLTAQYFTIYLLLAITRTFNHLRGSLRDTRCENILQLAAYTINLAPMLCVLFIAARVRALQMDPLHGHPQWWAQWCFYLCTLSAILQTIVVLVVPLVFGGEVRKGRSEGDITFRTTLPAVSGALTGIRVVALVLLYAGYAGVLVSVLLIEHPRGPDYTPPVSTAMQCVMALSILYFFIYLCLILMNLIKPLAGEDRVEGLQSTLEAARLTVMIY